MIKKKKGDSLIFTVTSNNLHLIDAVWANWSCTYEITQTITSETLLTGTMDREPLIGHFSKHIDYTFMETLDLGSYVIIAKIYNNNLNYRQESKPEVLEIIQNGI